MTRAQYEQLFKTGIEINLPANDKPALREAWNNNIDALVKEGTLPDRARDWSHPRRFYPYGSTENPLRNHKRKTRDEYQVHGCYAHGWEEVTAEDTRAEAKQRLKEYRENEPGTAFRLVRKRVPLAVIA